MPPGDGAAWSIDDVFKIPFTQALDLVRARSVYLHGGFAYVPRDRLVSILAGKFKAYVSQRAGCGQGMVV
jgi:DNA primase large subunit